MLILAWVIFGAAVASAGVVLMNVIGWRGVSQGSSDAQAAVLIPARNESENLPNCLASVLQQDNVCEVIVADDHSSDGTAAVAREWAARDSRVRLIQPPPLPPGWCGKSHACQQLGMATDASWLLFLDADARLEPGAVTRMLAQSEARDLTLLSCWPQLVMRGFWERLLMPLLNFVLLTLYPAPLATRRMQRSLGLAHGACILMHAPTYRAVGGHAAVRAELFEDTRLAQLWRANGQRGLCLDGTGTVRVRMYDSLPGIWAGFRKNLYPAFQRAFSFWLFMALHAGVFLLPFAMALILFGTAAGTFFAGAAGAVLLARLLLALRFGHPLWSVLLHPIGEIFVLLIGFASWLRVVSGRGVDWKGRRYRAAGETA